MLKYKINNPIEKAFKHQKGIREEEERHNNTLKK